MPRGRLQSTSGKREGTKNFLCQQRQLGTQYLLVFISRITQANTMYPTFIPLRPSIRWKNTSQDPKSYYKVHGWSGHAQKSFWPLSSSHISLSHIKGNFRKPPPPISKEACNGHAVKTQTIKKTPECVPRATNYLFNATADRFPRISSDQSLKVAYEWSNPIKNYFKKQPQTTPAVSNSPSVKITNSAKPAHQNKAPG